MKRLGVFVGTGGLFVRDMARKMLQLEDPARVVKAVQEITPADLKAMRVINETFRKRTAAAVLEMPLPDIPTTDEALELPESTGLGSVLGFSNGKRGRARMGKIEWESILVPMAVGALTEFVLPEDTPEFLLNGLDNLASQFAPPPPVLAPTPTPAPGLPTVDPKTATGIAQGLATAWAVNEALGRTEQLTKIRTAIGGLPPALQQQVNALVPSARQQVASVGPQQVLGVLLAGAGAISSMQALYTQAGKSDPRIAALAQAINDAYAVAQTATRNASVEAGQNAALSWGVTGGFGDEALKGLQDNPPPGGEPEFPIVPVAVGAGVLTAGGIAAATLL